MPVSDEPDDFTESFREGYVAGEQRILEVLIKYGLELAQRHAAYEIRGAHMAQIGSFQDGRHAAMEAFLDRHCKHPAQVMDKSCKGACNGVWMLDE